MECVAAPDVIARKLEGMLREPEAEELEMHLAGCARCRAELLLQVSIRQALSEEAPPGLSHGFTRGVCERAMRIPRRERRFAVALTLVPYVALPVAIALLAFAGGGFRRALLPLSESVLAVLFEPIAWLGRIVGGAFSGLAEGPAALLLPAGGVPEPLASTILLTLVTAVPAAWGLYRVHAFLRD